MTSHFYCVGNDSTDVNWEGKSFVHYYGSHISSLCMHFNRMRYNIGFCFWGGGKGIMCPHAISRA